jgi:hypothetical protein
VNRGRLDFDTRKDSAKDRSGRGCHPLFSRSATQRVSPVTRPKVATFTITPGSRKTALVNLALKAWREGEFDPRDLGQVRGRDVDEAGLQRALYRTSVLQIEYLLGPILNGRRVISRGVFPTRDDTPSFASGLRWRNRGQKTRSAT